MKLTPEELITAVDRMEVLRYFPSSKPARDEIASLLSEMIQTDQWGTAQSKLDWLIRALRDNVGEWPGPKELRGVYCCKFRPSDGIEAFSVLPGFVQDDGEERASCLSAPAKETVYLPEPGDEPIGDLEKQIALVAKKKKVG